MLCGETRSKCQSPESYAWVLQTTSGQLAQQVTILHPFVYFYHAVKTHKWAVVVKQMLYLQALFVQALILPELTCCSTQLQSLQFAAGLQQVDLCYTRHHRVLCHHWACVQGHVEVAQSCTMISSRREEQLVQTLKMILGKRFACLSVS